MLLAGDIGGTKTVLAIVTPEAGPRRPLAQAVFPSARYPSLEAIALEFLAGRSWPIDHAAFGVAGPVIGGRVTTTNLPWVVEGERLARALGLDHVLLLNDLGAIANAVPALLPEDYYTLVPGTPLPGGAIGVIAPGTGLGEAFLTWDGSRYRAHPSEGGHADFAPADDLQLGLLGYLMPRLGHVSFERVCSGIGIPNLYAYLRDEGHGEEPAWLAALLASAADPTPVIVQAAFDVQRPSLLCRATVNLFVDILGAEAGNLALKVLATGGIYIGGGIPPRILPALKGERILEAFRAKGRFAEFLAQVPVHVIVNPGVALLGAASYGLGESC